MASGPDWSCIDAPPLGGTLGSWAYVKALLLNITTDPKGGILELTRRREHALEVIYEPAAEAQCAVGHYALRLAFYLLVNPEERREHLQDETSPFALASALQLLASGWPVFGLLGILAYKLARDGLAPPPGSCGQELDSYRQRYASAALEGEAIRFSRDVERDVEAERPASTSCPLASSLPLLGHAASIACLARRDGQLRERVWELVQSADWRFLRPSAVTLWALLSAGLWAAEALMLLQRTAPALLAPEVESGEVVVSVGAEEVRWGLPAFVGHVWGGAAVAGWRVRPALPCADVLVARDGLPGLPFPGAVLYVDHEAGLAGARDAGWLDTELAKYRAVYLGVLEPLAETRCLSRAGTASAQVRRVCAKVYVGRAAGVAPVVLHVPFASTSFAARRAQSPLDLATSRRPFESKPKFLAYLAYTCVDHRERLFDLLVQTGAQRGLGSADALSVCAGYRSSHRRVRRNHTRGDEGGLLDDAVRLLRPYRFALVFENKLVPGYVTEKIVNAFLAGCIPIYWGSRAVLDIFNSDALVYANELQAPGGSDEAAVDPLLRLERVAQHVARLAADEAAMKRIATAPVLSEVQLRRYFSWHRAVRRRLGGGDHLAQRLSLALDKLMSPRQRLRRCEDGSGRVCSLPF